MCYLFFFREVFLRGIGYMLRIRYIVINIGGAGVLGVNSFVKL